MHTFAFPKYCSELKCNSNSASAAFNKWLKPGTEGRCVVHSFRHSLGNRPRAVECPVDIVDAPGGWSVEGVGQQYGTGYSTDVLYKWISKIVL